MAQYQSGLIHSNLKLLSHSSSVLLHKCPRKYELYKLLPFDLRDMDEDDPDNHLGFGTLVGEGVQHYLQFDNEKKAAFQTFLNWKGDIDDDNGERKKKTFWHALYAVDKFTGFRKTALANYDLAYFDGKPAIELGFSIDLGDGFFYRGFLDALLIDRVKRVLVPLENKTTGTREVHEATFKHSGQALGYSLVLDAIASQLGQELGSSFKVLYCIYKTPSYEWELMPFAKTFTQRATWIKNLLVDKETVIRYAQDGFFPMHGESCYDFFRECKHFGTCEMSNKFLLAGEIDERKEDESRYQFKFHINDLIDAQLAMHAETGV